MIPGEVNTVLRGSRKRFLVKWHPHVLHSSFIGDPTSNRANRGVDGDGPVHSSSLRPVALQSIRHPCC